MNLYTVRDSKAGTYNKPHTAINDAEAQRGFHSAVNDPNTFVNKYPEDFDLYRIGTFDVQSGKILAEDTPLHVVKAVALKN